MNAQNTKLQAVENDLKQLMADLARATEKAQAACGENIPEAPVRGTHSFVARAYSRPSSNSPVKFAAKFGSSQARRTPASETSAAERTHLKETDNRSDRPWRRSAA